MVSSSWNIYNPVNVVVYDRGSCLTRNPSTTVLRLDNDTTDNVEFELQTPGGVFVLAKQSVDADDLENLTFFKNVYNFVFTKNGQTKTVSNVSTDDTMDLKISSIFSDNYEGITRDDGAKPIQAGALLKDFFSGGPLSDILSVIGGSPDDKLEHALVKLQAHPKQK